MSKSDLSERKICTKYIAPAVSGAAVLVVDGPRAQP